MTNIIARIALPIVSAGILGGAALGLAGMASAPDHHRREQHRHRDRRHPGHLREARPDLQAGLAQPQGNGPLVPVHPVSPQLNNN